MKLCRDCVHCRPAREHDGLDRLEFARCKRPIERDYGSEVVTGIVKYRRCKNYCATEREFSCGMDAKFFEPRTAASNPPRSFAERVAAVCHWVFG